MPRLPDAVREAGRAVAAGFRFRRNRDVVLTFAPLAAYIALGAVMAWFVPPQWPTVVIWLAFAALAGSRATRFWDRAGGVAYASAYMSFSCRQDGCAVDYAHVDPARVHAFANRHLAEVHRVEAPNWTPPGAG